MPTILVVDDDPSIVDAISAALEIKGYVVVSTTDADYAAPLALECVPNLILLDYLLSGSDGTEVLQDLQQSSVTASMSLWSFVVIRELSGRL